MPLLPRGRAGHETQFLFASAEMAVVTGVVRGVAGVLVAYADAGARSVKVAATLLSTPMLGVVLMQAVKSTASPGAACEQTSRESRRRWRRGERLESEAATSS